MPSELVSPPHLLSIVITVRNEEAHLAALLESLLKQEPPFEIVLVDALSTDRTFAIAEEYAAKHPEVLRLFQAAGKRGAGRNYGARQARGEWLVFTDGDCVADSRWLPSLRAGMGSASVVAGKTVTIGNPSYVNLERVELYQQDMDVTYPSCNLAYRKDLFVRLGGFDDRFVTAEDIDLNLRAVRAGATLRSCPEAIVYHATRANPLQFFTQAFWNGWGRKQLTEKHGSLWSRYRYKRMFIAQHTPTAYVRMVAALTGYFMRLVTASGSRERIRPDRSE